MPSLIATVKDNRIMQAVELLQEGKLVCFPTETVYALAADSTNDSAVARIYTAKGRNLHTPLAVLVASIEQARAIAHFDARAEILASRLFPGPLTLVLPARKNTAISPLLNQGKQTIAVRIPDHPIALAILSAFGRPIAATSTNLSGHPSAISVAMIDEQLKKHLAVIIDDGISPLQAGSTIVDLSTESIEILREGSIRYAEVMEILL